MQQFFQVAMPLTEPFGWIRRQANGKAVLITLAHYLNGYWFTIIYARHHPT
jgi:hypothetical protein